jgi:chromosome segregation protein
MYLKSLQLVGFKSFAEKTALDFLPGVTAIVGPNGCGKSNVADAIRWVLGEQSAKALRGSEMADVIFNGTDGRKAIGMAEVSMTFADVDPKALSLPGVNLDFTEITITRRVYRDGTGEYLINKTPCRLRDIQNLFMDTGIGRSSYSLMAQGQIDQILSAHPEDRRNIFEEAAGINKYKHQKKEALRKLEYTEANLVRLTDIIKEVKRQIISLQRQAGKARRYKELFDELKGLDTKLSRRKFDLLQADIADLETQIAEIASRSQHFAADIAERENQIAALRQSLAAVDHAVTEAIAREHELKSETDRHQQRISSNTERIADSEQQIEKNRREIAGAEEKIHIQEQELARLNAEFDQIAFLLNAEQGKLQAQQDDLRALDARLAQEQRTLDTTKGALLDAERQIAGSHNELAALDLRRKADLVRAERLSTERLQLEDQRVAKQQHLLSFQTNLTALRSGLAPLREALTGYLVRQKELSQHTIELAGQQRATEAELSKKSARLEVLRTFFAAPDGRTALANILEVEPQYGAAVEAALSGALRTVLADDLASARSLLAGNVVTAPELLAPVVVQELPGIAALSVVRAKDERFTPLLQSLLVNVVIAENLDAALALRQQHPQLTIATLAGELVSAHGTLSKVGTSHIGEINALAGELTGVQARSAELTAQLSTAENQRRELEEVIGTARGELHANEVAVAGKEGELNSLTTDQRDLDSKLHTVLFELQSIEHQDAADQQRRSELQAGIGATEARLQALRDQLGSGTATVEDLRRHRDEMSEELTKLKISAGGLEHRKSSIESQRDPIAGRIRDFRERMQTCSGEIESFTARIGQFRAEIVESEQRVAGLQTEREGAAQRLAGLQHQRQEVATGIDQAEGELKAVRLQAAEAQEQKSGFEVALAQKQMGIQQLRERVQQKYQMNLEDIPADVMVLTVADQGPVVTEQVARPTNWEAIEQQVIELQSRLDAMGPVNLEAIHEFDELEQRFKFLSQQHDDLTKAKEQLLQVISKINTTTKQLFSETFEKVRTNFQGMFTELFGGGKANLILLDENDPLESGIEIVAKPPGKQLQSITLLSGGEKTLTATALLFSIYMVKPSPFCVLDELDAPLDESNINRFIRVLARFIHQSQFVIITHNKRTIGMADALYGITMEEHGISKVVSVKFSPRQETERKEREKSLESQEERIDGAAVIAAGPRPHEEELRNDLLVAKESTIGQIADATPVIAETQPMLVDPAPEVVAMKAEVQAAVSEALETVEAAQQAVAAIKSEEPADPQSPSPALVSSN